MLRPEGEGLRVYLHREPIDMRLQRTGLAALVQEAIREDPFEANAIYAFVGARTARHALRPHASRHRLTPRQFAPLRTRFCRETPSARD